MDPQVIIKNFRDVITNHYFDMTGRVSRPDFWYFVLACFVSFVAVAVVDRIIGTGLLPTILVLALTLPQAGMGARRLQDIGKDGALVWALMVPSTILQLMGLLASLAGPFGIAGFLYFFFTIGWLINLITLVALVAMVYFWTQPGTAGPNQYGPAPATATA